MQIFAVVIYCIYKFGLKNFVPNSVSVKQNIFVMNINLKCPRSSTFLQAFSKLSLVWHPGRTELTRVHDTSLLSLLCNKVLSSRDFYNTRLSRILQKYTYTFLFFLLLFWRMVRLAYIRTSKFRYPFVDLMTKAIFKFICNQITLASVTTFFFSLLFFFLRYRYCLEI